jgi:hypothetical protein
MVQALYDKQNLIIYQHDLYTPTLRAFRLGSRGKAGTQQASSSPSLEEGRSLQIANFPRDQNTRKCQLLCFILCTSMTPSTRACEYGGRLMSAACGWQYRTCEQQRGHNSSGRRVLPPVFFVRSHRTTRYLGFFFVRTSIRTSVSVQHWALVAKEF